jgi:hypothetical protein
VRLNREALDGWQPALLRVMERLAEEKSSVEE